MLVLPEDFAAFRSHCEYRKYYQEYANDEYIHNGRVIGEPGKDYGYIKCTHEGHKKCGGWCKDDATADSCPRLINLGQPLKLSPEELDYLSSIPSLPTPDFIEYLHLLQLNHKRPSRRKTGGNVHTRAAGGRKERQHEM